jgi:hypothetical protein
LRCRPRAAPHAAVAATAQIRAIHSVRYATR